MPVENPKLRLRIHGAVQGVGFRYHVRQAARRLGLAGWVLNRTDGAVELEAGGDPRALEQFRQAVTRGPPLAHVERVESLEPGDDTLPVPFEVRR